MSCENIERLTFSLRTQRIMRARPMKNKGKIIDITRGIEEITFYAQTKSNPIVNDVRILDI